MKSKGGVAGSDSKRVLFLQKGKEVKDMSF